MYPSMLKALGWLPALQKLDVMAYVFVLPALARYRQGRQELKIILSLHGSLRPAWDTGDLVSKKRKKKPEEALGGGCPNGAEAAHLCEGPFPSVPPIAAGKKLANALG